MTAPPLPAEAYETSFTAFLAGFFFSFRAAVVMISVRWLGLGSEPGVITILAIELLLLLSIAFQAAGPARPSPLSLARNSTLRWVFLFLAFSVTSLAWSATVSRPASFLYWCALAADVVSVLLLLRNRPISQVAPSLMRGFIVSTCVLACIAWIMPAAEDLRLGDLDYFNTNQIGNLCALAIFMAQFLTAHKNGKWKFAILFLTLTLLRSLSKATILAFIFAEGFLLIYDTTMSRRKKVALAATALVLVIAFAGLILAYLDIYTTTGNQAETLTGRTAIWAYTLDASLDKPWYGNGIDAMWKVFPPFGKEMFEARHAENELLQQFFSYGLAGVIMLLGLYGSLFRKIAAMPKGLPRAILLGVMLFVVVRGLAEAEPFDLLLPLWMIALLACVTEDAAGASQTSPAASLASIRLSSAAISGSSAI